MAIPTLSQLQHYQSNGTELEQSIATDLIQLFEDNLTINMLVEDIQESDDYDYTVDDLEIFLGNF